MQIKKDERNEIKSTSHSRYRCQYHIVFAPKYRRKEIYGQLKKDIGEILQTLCKQKNVEILEAEACVDHIHIRYILPKGRPFTTLTKVQVITMMNHINSTARASLNGRTSLLLPDALLRWSGAAAIPHDEVLLKPRLLKMPQP